MQLKSFSWLWACTHLWDFLQKMSGEWWKLVTVIFYSKLQKNSQSLVSYFGYTEPSTDKPPWFYIKRDKKKQCTGVVFLILFGEFKTRLRKAEGYRQTPVYTLFSVKNSCQDMKDVPGKTSSCHGDVRCRHSDLSRHRKPHGMESAPETAPATSMETQHSEKGNNPILYTAQCVPAGFRQAHPPTPKHVPPHADSHNTTNLNLKCHCHDNKGHYYGLTGVKRK